MRYISAIYKPKGVIFKLGSDDAIQFIILIILLLLSGFFSSAETALTTASQIRMRTLEEEGNKRAKTVLRITENSSKLLSTILIGNNIVNTAAASLATTIAYKLGGCRKCDHYSADSSVRRNHAKDNCDCLRGEDFSALFTCHQLSHESHDTGYFHHQWTVLFDSSYFSYRSKCEESYND